MRDAAKSPKLLRREVPESSASESAATRMYEKPSICSLPDQLVPSSLRKVAVLDLIVIKVAVVGIVLTVIVFAGVIVIMRAVASGEGLGEKDEQSAGGEGGNVLGDCLLHK